MNPEHANPASVASLQFATPGGLVDPDVAGTADVQLWADGEVIALLDAARRNATQRPAKRVAAA